MTKDFCFIFSLEQVILVSTKVIHKTPTFVLPKFHQLVSQSILIELVVSDPDLI